MLAVTPLHLSLSLCPPDNNASSLVFRNEADEYLLYIIKSDKTGLIELSSTYGLIKPRSSCNVEARVNTSTSCMGGTNTSGFTENSIFTTITALATNDERGRRYKAHYVIVGKSELSRCLKQFGCDIKTNGGVIQKTTLREAAKYFISHSNEIAAKSSLSSRKVGVVKFSITIELPADDFDGAEAPDNNKVSDDMADRISEFVDLTYKAVVDGATHNTESATSSAVETHENSLNLLNISSNTQKTNRGRSKKTKEQQQTIGNSKVASKNINIICDDEDSDNNDNDSDSNNGCSSYSNESNNNNIIRNVYPTSNKNNNNKSRNCNVGDEKDNNCDGKENRNIDGTSSVSNEENILSNNANRNEHSANSSKCNKTQDISLLNEEEVGQYSLKIAASPAGNDNEASAMLQTTSITNQAQNIITTNHSVDATIKVNSKSEKPDLIEIETKKISTALINNTRETFKAINNNNMDDDSNDAASANDIINTNAEIKSKTPDNTIKSKCDGEKNDGTILTEAKKEDASTILIKTEQVETIQQTLPKSLFDVQLNDAIKPIATTNKDDEKSEDKREENSQLQNNQKQNIMENEGKYQEKVEPTKTMNEIQQLTKTTSLLLKKQFSLLDLIAYTIALMLLWSIILVFVPNKLHIHNDKK